MVVLGNDNAASTLTTSQVSFKAEKGSNRFQTRTKFYKQHTSIGKLQVKVFLSSIITFRWSNCDSNFSSSTRRNVELEVLNVWNLSFLIRIWCNQPLTLQLQVLL